MVSVIDLLYRHRIVEYARRFKDLTNEKVIYVSDLVSCPYKRVLRIKYPFLSFEFEPKSLLGELVHIGIEELVTSMQAEEYHWAKEVEVAKTVIVNNEEYVVKGRIDLVAYVKETSEPKYVVEIKTTRKTVNNPLDHHVLQLQIYMDIIKAEKGVLLYVSFDKVTEFSFNRASINVESLVADLLMLRRVPRYEWECRYCPFKRICPYAKY